MDAIRLNCNRAITNLHTFNLKMMEPLEHLDIVPYLTVTAEERWLIFPIVSMPILKPIATDEYVATNHVQAP